MYNYIAVNKKRVLYCHFCLERSDIENEDVDFDNINQNKEFEQDKELDVSITTFDKNTSSLPGYNICKKYNKKF